MDKLKKKQDEDLELFEPQFSILDPEPGGYTKPNETSDYIRDPSAPIGTTPGGVSADMTVGGSVPSSSPVGGSALDILRGMASRPARSAPQYGGSKWDSVLDDTSRQLIEMTYENFSKGPEYAAIQNRMREQGQMAMDDTIGKVSARTGGLASSYAGTAGQQAYNKFMAQVEPAARDAFARERAILAENAALAGRNADKDYGRFMDELGQFNRDRDFDESRSNNALDMLYRASRDEIADKRYDQEYADERSDMKRKDAQDRVNAYLAAYGSVSKLPADLIEASGYSREELTGLESYYKEQKAAKAAAAAAKSSGGGRSGGSAKKSGSKFNGDWSEVEEYVGHGGDAEDYIGANYKEMGFSSVNQAKSAWKVHKQEGRKPTESQLWNNPNLSDKKKLIIIENAVKSGKMPPEIGAAYLEAMGLA